MFKGIHIRSKLISRTEKGPARVVRSIFENEHQMWSELLQKCGEGRILGGIIGEMLKYGGSHHLMWIDIDSRDHWAVNRWLREGPFPAGSFRAIPSTTGKVHVYVSTDRPLPRQNELSMAIWLRGTMPEGLRGYLDQVRGPEGKSHVYFPFAGKGRAVMPQKLMEGTTSTFMLPYDLEGSDYDEFIKRRLKELIRSV